ncbi:MAG: cation diffusion facilitator family transporter [Chloroflexota bacterium]
MSTSGHQQDTSSVQSTRERNSLQAVNLALGTNTLLAVVKVAIGIIGHSPALLADGINSTSDVVYNLVVAIFVRLSHKPADREHPFGHSQFESIAALTVGAFVITTAISIFWDAVSAVFDQVTGQTVLPGASPLAFWVALATIGLKTFLFHYTNRIGKQANNPAVMALALDHRNDIFSASAALAGISLGRIGYTWIDPLAGALVSLVVLRTGIQILRQSASELMDTLPGQALEKQILQVLGSVPGICEVEDIHAHRFGPYLMINLTICVDGEISVAKGDRIATLAEEKLTGTIPYLHTVHIHYHPTGETANPQHDGG